MTAPPGAGDGVSLPSNLLLLAWLLLPNAAIMAITNIRGVQGAGMLVVSLSIFACPAIFVASMRGLFIFNAPWALLSGFVTGLMILHGSPITSGLIQSVFATDVREAREHLAAYALAVGLALAGFTAYMFIALRLSGRTIPARKYLIAGGLWGIAGVIYIPYLAFEVFERFDLSVETTFANSAFPLNVINATRFALQQHRLAIGSDPLLPKLPPIAPEPRRIYVLVIGESTRAQTFHELEAETPVVSGIAGVVQFPDALAQANFTDASVPMLLTGARTLAESRQYSDLIRWQNAAGCVTAAVSNNTQYEWAGAARFRDVAGDGGVTHLTRYDHDMLDTVSGLLNATAPKHLCLTVHMVGSHFDYTARYRSEFERYPLHGDSVQRLRAAYKNSVVMVQDFLSRLIARLDRIDAETLLVFASDHGENLMEIDRLREHVSSEPTEYELRVPLVVWGNTSFRSSHAGRWAILQDNRMLPVSNASVAPTILDAMGIPEQYFPADRSLFRKQMVSDRLFVRPDYTIHSERAMRLAPPQPHARDRPPG